MRIAHLNPCFAAAFVLACAPAPRPAETPTPASTGTPNVTRSLAATTDSTVDLRRAGVRQVLQQIAGRESEPAGQVFKNITTEAFQTFPASRIPAMMDQGYGRALGVSCDYCHIVGHWESDSLTTKRIARQMQAMVFAINSDLLSKTGVRAGAVVNCTTCHRGAAKPVSNLATRPSGP